MNEKDISHLKSRMERAISSLNAANFGRAGVNEGLNKMWRLFQDRFDRQNSELTRLLSRIGYLEKNQNELADLFEDFLGRIDSNIGIIPDNSLQLFSEKDAELLEAEPSERESDDETGGIYLDDTPSPAIRSLISRVQDAFEPGEKRNSPSEELPNESQKELERDLKEIENLRNELQRLRARMAEER